MISEKEILENCLAKYGVDLIDRPDYFTGKNRTLTVIIDERIEYDTVIFEDALSVFMSSRTMYHVLDVIEKNIYHKFVKDFMYAVNKFTRMWQMSVKPHGKYFWEVAINQVTESLMRMGIVLDKFNFLEYLKCIKTFGGTRGFREYIYSSINQDLNGNIPQCLYCENCRVDKNGNRRCKKYAVTTENKRHHSTLMYILTLDKTASNYCDDINLYLAGEKCSEFCPRNTRFINRCIRVKNKK